MKEGSWRKLHNKELHNVLIYSSANITTVWRMSLAEHTVCNSHKKCIHLLPENLVLIDNLGDLGIDLRTDLQEIC
jgi:hypothetical protein